MAPSRSRALLFKYFCLCLLTFSLSFCLRLLEWPCWQNPEYRLDNEFLLATHDAYHWLAGAEGFGLAVDHPMSVFLKRASAILDQPPARVAFWAPPVMASLTALAAQILALSLGGLSCSVVAGLIASVAPGFLGRTLLGYFDTDLITLFFPLLIILAPVAWLRRSTLSPGEVFAQRFRGEKNPRADDLTQGALSPLWLALLALSGLIAWQSQFWHSVFPYLIRYNVVCLVFLALVLAPRGRAARLLLAALAYAFPCAAGPAGLLFPFLVFFLFKRWDYLARKYKIAILTISLVLLLAALLRGEILDILRDQINAYLKRSGDSHSSGGVSLVFPSVAQSIIEVQDLSFAALFPYFHPWFEAALLGVVGYFIIALRRPAALFLLPLAALGFLSSRLGGRMVMFGAPIVALGLTVPCVWTFQALLGKRRAWSGGLACLVCAAAFVAPFLDMIPALSQGPSINRRHAQALAEARSFAPEDAVLWLWWDWGYAAHYFARRRTIADGARHGGPSLYLPAAAFAAEKPRFARQIIRRASALDNEPGNFFKGLDAEEAQKLIDNLRSSQTPLAPGRGRQYIVVSFEMLRLGFWISNFGNWNFVSGKGEGGALSILPQGLSYRLNSGEVRLEGSESVIFPSSITVFDETGIIKRNYIREWFDAHPGASAAQSRAWLAARRNVNFLLNRVTDEKIAADAGIYNSMMVKLLICDPLDPELAPYFKLVYDNVFARIYEVLPAPGEGEN